jgi:hypothetical protein
VTLLQWLTFALEFAKALAWPIVAGFAVWWLRPFLIGLRRGKLELEAGGFKARIDVAEQLQVVEAENAAQRNLLPPVPLPPPSDRPAITIVEQRLQDQLSKLPEEQRQPILVRALATAWMERGHEFVYNRIFGSQIRGLKTLDDMGGAPVDQAREFFKPYAEKFPDVYASYGFDGWLRFLVPHLPA